MVQFLKSGDWNVGEEVARELGVDWLALGEGFTWGLESLEHDIEIARSAWACCGGDHPAGEHELVVLDADLPDLRGNGSTTSVCSLTICERPQQVNIIVTGRDAPAVLIDVADTVTEMRKVEARVRRRHRRQEDLDLPIDPPGRPLGLDPTATRPSSSCSSS